jgi:GT2 family glycosyltransferase
MIAVPSWFRSLIRGLVHSGEHAVVTGRVLPTVAEVPDGFVPAVVVAKDPAVYKGRIGMDVLASGHMATYRSILEAVGAFDEHLGPGTEFPAAEDNDLGFRLLEAGYSIVYAPEAVLYHRAWRGRPDYLSMRWAYGRGKGGFYTKHLSLRDPYMLCRLFWDITYRLLFLPYRVGSQPRRACGDVIYIGGVLTGIVRWLMPRRSFRCAPFHSHD